MLRFGNYDRYRNLFTQTGIVAGFSVCARSTFAFTLIVATFLVNALRKTVTIFGADEFVFSRVAASITAGRETVLRAGVVRFDDAANAVTTIATVYGTVLGSFPPVTGPVTTWCQAVLRAVGRVFKFDPTYSVTANGTVRRAVYGILSA